MKRWARIATLTLALGCRARALGVAGASAPEFDPEPIIRQSREPFVENPRFCGPQIGNACRVVPTPC